MWIGRGVKAFRKGSGVYIGWDRRYLARITIREEKGVIGIVARALLAVVANIPT